LSIYKCKNGHEEFRHDNDEEFSVLYLKSFNKKYGREDFERQLYHESYEALDLNEAKNEHECSVCCDKNRTKSARGTYSNFGQIIAINPIYYITSQDKEGQKCESPVEIPPEIRMEGKLYHLHAYIRRETIFDPNILDSEGHEAEPLFHYVAVVQKDSTWIVIDDDDMTQVTDPFCFRMYDEDHFPFNREYLRNRPLPHVLFYILNDEKSLREGNVSLGQDKCLCVQVDQNEIIKKCSDKTRKALTRMLRKSVLDIKEMKVNELRNVVIEHEKDVAFYEQVKKLLDLRAENEVIHDASKGKSPDDMCFQNVRRRR